MKPYETNPSTHFDKVLYPVGLQKRQGRKASGREGCWVPPSPPKLDTF